MNVLRVVAIVAGALVFVCVGLYASLFAWVEIVGVPMQDPRSMIPSLGYLAIGVAAASFLSAYKLLRTLRKPSGSD